MPTYEYLCRTCDTRFEARRPMSEATSPMACPVGHEETTRLLSVFAAVGGRAESAMPRPTAGGPASGGCGPACACAS
jgi:putative FmdB family regulatory protein